MAEVLATCIALGSGIVVALAYLGGKPGENYELWAARGTAFGFLVGLFLVICCPEASELLCRQ
jgi:hypothetical protein